MECFDQWKQMLKLVVESRSMLETNTLDLAFKLVPVLYAQLSELGQEFFEGENFLAA